MTSIDALFGTGPKLGWGQECARALLVFVYGLVVIRVAGRRIFGSWAAVDIIVSIVVGSSLSRAITGGADLVGTLAAMTALIALHRLLSVAAARWPAVSRLIEGLPVVLARDGRVLGACMVAHAVSHPDLHEAMRRVGVEEVRGTKEITLEPSGNITVVKAS